MTLEEIDYALAKQVPAMNGGFTVATSYGDITVPYGPVADQIARWVRRALETESFRLQRAAERAKANA